MGKQIEPKLRKIGEYLKLDENTIFRIPEYQRPYSWNEEQCDKLWQDIWDFIESENKDRYFFGTIIINCNENDTKLDLIDGQQRTTTFLLLLKAILFRINDAILNYISDVQSEELFRGLKERRRKIIGILYGVETESISDVPNEEKDEIIYEKVNIIENTAIREEYKTEMINILKSSSFDDVEKNVIKKPYKQKDNKYTNYFRNFKFFYEKCNLQDNELNILAKNIIENCEVIEIKSWNVEQAITMFNSLNADGLPLCDADIITAKLYSVAQKDNVKDSFIKSWEEFQNLINNLEEKKILDIDSIFMQQMYYERTKNNETVTNTGSVTVTTPGLRRYFTEINKNFINNPLESCNNIINLAKIWNKISDYPIAKVLFKFNENFKLFLASYLYRFKEEDIIELKKNENNEVYEEEIKSDKKNTIKEDIETILECMLRLFTILELVDTGYSSSKFKTFLFTEESKFINNNISVKEIKTDFNEHIKKNWNKEEIKKYIYNCENNSLIFLNEYLFAKEHNIDFDLENQYDIEHIMPNSGNNLQIIRQDAQLINEEEFKEYVDKIGNKILLEYKINRSIGNEWFRTKISTTIKDKTGYKDSKFPIASQLVNKYQLQKDKAYWVKDDIITATNDAVERIANFIFDE